jgi:hypothetical protein
LGLSRKISEGKPPRAHQSPSGKIPREDAFFCVTTIASGWCKVLKPVYDLDLTVIWGGFFHKLFNRLDENAMNGMVEKKKQRAAERLEVHCPAGFIPTKPPRPSGFSASRTLFA